MGVYVFGGEKENRRPTNELFFIRATEKRPVSAMKFGTSLLSSKRASSARLSGVL